MKKLFALFLLVVSISGSVTIVTSPYAEARSSRSSSSDVYVKGYTRSNGTYVAPYYRTRPDSSRTNNYGCIDYGRCR